MAFSVVCYLVMNHPFYSKLAVLSFQEPTKAFEILKLMRDQDKNYACMHGIENALIKAGLTPRVSLKCSVVKSIRFENKNVKIVNVYYEPYGGDMGGDRSVPVLALPNKTFVVLPHQFFRGFDLLDYISERAKAPFAGGWSSFTLEAFANEKLIRKDGYFCIVYTFNFPFVGEVTQCPKSDVLNDFRNKANDFYGEVGYLPNILQWEEALSLALEECPKYGGAKCKYSISEWARESKYDYWSGAHANSAIKISSALFKKIDYYLFTVELYNKGREDTILVKVFSNKKVRSKLVARKSYKAEEMLDLAKTF